ncbi:MAG: LL-diaminopimelate aminotransferase [bacterium]
MLPETKKIVPAERILNLPPYVFAELDVWKEEALANGINYIDLGMGNHDGATPAPIVDAAVKSLYEAKNHGYPSFKGKKEFREAISQWMKKRYDVEVCPELEVQTLLGAKEGLAHLAMAYTNPGDINIVPDPYYPVHSRGTWLANGEIYHIKLEEKNNFLPDLDSIPEDVARRAKIFFINYPNNPTSAIAPVEYLEKLVAYCKKYGILLCSDLAYGEICFDGYRPPSIFSIPCAKDIAIEFHTFSKTFNMAGWRIGFAVGNKEYIHALYTLKTNVDYGTSSICQEAAIAALNVDRPHIDAIVNKYQQRRDLLVDGFKKLGWNVSTPKATMYLWLKVPTGFDSKSWCKMVLNTAGIVFTPGMAFGEHSDGYFRVSLVQPEEKLLEALSRLEKAGIRYA